MIEIRKTDAEQPWHVVIVGDGNHKDLLIGENLANKQDAFNQITAAAYVFGLTNVEFKVIDLGENEEHYSMTANQILGSPMLVKVVDNASQES